MNICKNIICSLIGIVIAVSVNAQSNSTLLKELSTNTKLIDAQTLLKPFDDGESIIKVVVTLKPSQRSEQLSAQSISANNKSAMSQGNSQQYGSTYYDLEDEDIKLELNQTVSETLSSFLLNIQAKQANRAANQSLTTKPIVITNQFKYVFGFAADVSAEGLQLLLAEDDVILIEENLILKPHLNQGIPLMNGSSARSSYNGSGVAIAIADTGIDTSHPRLDGGKVLGGFDFGMNDPNFTPAGNAHGTAVAGISAGDLGAVGDYIGGVAPGAKLYGLKISRDSDHQATSADMVDAWEWAMDHKNDDPNNPILVVNTSFGGGRHFSACDNINSAMTQAAFDGVNAGITFFASSGNDGYCDSMGWPACISHVNAIGAVYDANFGNRGTCISNNSCLTSTFNPQCPAGTGAFFENTLPDKVTAYSNSDTNLAFFASSNNATTTDISGGGGYSSGDYTTTFGGTSAASPYAAGAAAVLQHAAKSITGNYLTPAEVKSIFQSTGDMVTDTKVALTKPRINLGNAVASIAPPATTRAMTTSGQVCKPANLNQALAFGLGWSQQGTTNNSPIGGGSFFVVCPLMVDQTEQAFNFFDIEVQYLSAAAPNISCTIYQVDVGNGSAMVENVQAVPASSIANPGSGSYPIGVKATVIPVGFSYSAGDNALSVVCAMHPQTRIGHFGVNNN